MKLVGRYQVTSRIGQGAMANVYRAHDPDIRRDLAIKILNQKYRRDPECVARFLREARAAGSLSHPNIVTIYDVGEAEGFPYLAMELLDGKTLDAAITEKGAFPVADVIAVGTQIADALRYAHSLGIVHRDIKPSNIFLCGDGLTVKLLDFGIARVAEADAKQEATETLKTQIGQVLGTPRYMSPEQALGQELDGRSDLFSLGAILFEMITGRPAFDGVSLATLALQITAQPTPPITVMPECPRGLQFIVEKLLSKQPEKRFADGAELVEALKREASAYKSAVSEDRGRRLPLHLRFTLLASVVVASVLTFGIAFVLEQQYRAMERVAVTSGSSIASFVATNTALPMMENASLPTDQADWLPVQAFVNTASADATISELMIIDRTGIVRAAANAARIGSHYYTPARQAAFDQDLAVTVSSEAQDGRDYFRFTRPIYYGAKDVGQVDVRISKDALQAAAGLTRTLLIGLGVLMFAVALGLSFVAGRVVLGPIRRLNAALRLTAQGKFDFRISHRRRDEFGELFDNFNALATEVQDRVDRITRPSEEGKETILHDVAATMIRSNLQSPMERVA